MTHRRPRPRRRAASNSYASDPVPWVDELAGGRFLLPYYVNDGRRRPYRPEVLVWHADGEPVSYGLVDPRHPDPYRACVQELLEVRGGSVSIGRVRVTDGVLAAAAQALMRDVEVTVGPVPELEGPRLGGAAARGGREGRSGPAGPSRDRAPAPPLLSCDWLSAGVDPDEVAAFFRGARVLWRARAWEFAGDGGQVLTIWSPELGLRSPAIVFLDGRGPEPFGFTVFDSAETMLLAFDAPLGEYEPGRWAKRLVFTQRSRLTEASRRQLRDHGWKTAARAAVPVVTAMDRGGFRATPDVEDLRILNACARAVARFVEQYDELLELGFAGPVRAGWPVRGVPGTPLVCVSEPDAELCRMLEQYAARRRAERQADPAGRPTGRPRTHAPDPTDEEDPVEAAIGSRRRSS